MPPKKDTSWHKPFAHRLWIARDINGWTQTDVEYHSGIRSSLYSHYETGLQRPTLDNFRRLAVALDVPAGWLLSLEDWDKAGGK